MFKPRHPAKWFSAMSALAFCAAILGVIAYPQFQQNARIAGLKDLHATIFAGFWSISNRPSEVASIPRFA